MVKNIDSYPANRNAKKKFAEQRRVTTTWKTMVCVQVHFEGSVAAALGCDSSAMALRFGGLCSSMPRFELNLMVQPPKEPPKKSDK